MINNTIKMAKMAPLFKNNISKQIINDKKTNISNTLKNNLNSNTFSKDKLLKLYIKGLKIYINNLTSYNLKWNNKKLITTIKNKPLSTIDLLLTNVNKNNETNNENLNLNSITSINLNKNITTIKNSVINEEQINLLKNKVEIKTSINQLSNKENNLNMKENNLLLNKLSDKPMNEEKQEFFNSIELMIKDKKERDLNKENKKSIIKNKPLNLNTKSLSTTIATTNNLTATTNNTQNISKYLKSITIFNSIPKDKLLTFSQQLSYNFNTVNNKLIKKMYTFLFYSFFSMNSLISKPILDITPNKVIIHLFFFHFDFKNFYSNWSKKNKNFKQGLRRNLHSSKTMETETLKKNKFITINHKKLDLICKILSIFFKKPVELNLVKLNYPYLDSNIFVNLLALMINNRKIRQIMKRFFRFAVIKNIAKLSGKKIIGSSKIPSFLSGIKIRIAGRLLTQRVVPRKTVKIIRRGAFARGKVNFLDVARYTSKNKRGAFSITVTTGQNLIN